MCIKSDEKNEKIDVKDQGKIQENNEILLYQ
jgi:hypothetical protein